MPYARRRVLFEQRGSRPGTSLLVRKSRARLGGGGFRMRRDVTPRFELVFLPPAETPAVRAFVCHHVTPELVRRPDWQLHANGATALISVTVVCDDPVATAFGYLPIFGPERLKVLDGVTIVN